MTVTPRVTPIPRQTLVRLPYYVRYVMQAKEHGEAYVSSPAIAAELKLNEVQVRKDLAVISTRKGTPKKGFAVDGLLRDMRQLMGADNVNDAVLVGVGSLGQALLSYNGFEEYGLHVVAAFDLSKQRIGCSINKKQVFSMAKMEDLCKRLGIRMGIIAVPAEHAQAVCNQMIDSGILAILNFAPVRLTVPDGILVQYENIAASLMVLSQYLKEKIEEDYK